MKPKFQQPDLARIAGEMRERFYGFFIRARLAIIPIVVSVAVWIFFSDGALWRQMTMGAVIVALTIISIFDFYLHAKKGIIGNYAIPRNVIGAGTATLVLISASGGLDSPFLPVIAIVALVSTVFISPRLGRFIVICFQIPVIWACAIIAVFELSPTFIPDVFGGGTRVCDDEVLLWTQAVIYTIVLGVIVGFGGRIRATFELMVDRIFQERDKQLRIYRDQAETMKTLSGEIAHELKNPLASVKGLSALVSRRLEGKAAERMAVLHSEVERMQTILEEFLNFSRPLVPLSLESTDLLELSREVVDLHEGLARQLGIAMEVKDSVPVEIVCDPRKIKQVLINLVQNAMEASPQGGRVTLIVSDDAGQGCIRVVDEGPGLPKELAGKVFEAGVTSKPKGSGLGLTVARALARQHGGDLKLEEAAGGGCSVGLLLPVKPTLEEKNAVDGEAPSGDEL